jgi:uncharacterized membrane protein YqiK
MSKIVKYDVLREHEGDRFYKRGETRELAESDAQHLVSLGVLALPGATQKQPAAEGKTKADIAAEFNLFVDQANRAREAISQELAKAREAADAKLAEIGAEVSKARERADVELTEITGRVDAARREAEAKIGALAADVKKLKSEPGGKAKPEDQPSNKAEQASEKNK